MKYDLVFEGGGAKGMIFVGAMKEFEARGHTHGRVMGTSAGAITAALLAAGYSNEEMMAALEEQEEGHSIFSSFMGQPGPFSEDTIQDSAMRKFLEQLDLPLIPGGLEKKIDDSIVKLFATQSGFINIFSLIEDGGWFSADSFVDWITRKLNEGTFGGKQRDFGAKTLAQLYEITAVDLTLIASDITGEKILILNHRTAPHCPVVWAVRMSMNIPLLWQEVIWQQEWGLYRGKDIAGHAVVDGGMLSNFPIELFLSDEPMVTAVMGECTRDHVMGFLIDESVPVPNAPPPPEMTAQVADKKKGIDFTGLKTLQRIMHLLNTMMQAHDKMVIETFADLVVRLPAKDYGTVEFDMTDERRSALVKAGIDQMRAYLDTAELEVTSYSLGGLDEARRIANKIATRLLQ
ncbi:MAG: patatin-like phospholipase family protein [Anaerolineae bacterium]|nr:patatin-like phospholipase family protein [Anaerolineae bacterium]